MKMINIKKIKTNKFKINEIAIFITLPLKKETMSMNAILPNVLPRGTNKYKTQLDISKKLENMYGAAFNSGLDKTGNYAVLKFYIDSISNKYVLNNENIAQESMNLLLDIICNPLTEENAFKKEYVEQEKENLIKKIESKKDDKAFYAYERCIEEMFKNNPYGIYKYGEIKDVKAIDSKKLYEYYLEVLKTAKIDIYISGSDSDEINVNIDEYKVLKDNNDAEIEKEINQEKSNESEKIAEEKVIKEKSDVTQGKLIIGLNANCKNKYAMSMLNAILGGGANSKLFQNVREKASLAYYSSSRYLRRKDAIIIRTGIKLENYDKAVKIIKEQINEIKKGNITDFEFNSAKQLLLSSLKELKESQEDQITFDFDQNLFNEKLTLDEYYKKIENVTMNDVIEASKTISTNTIYYLEK